MVSPHVSSRYRQCFRSIVLLVGDFSQPETFASRAWDRLMMEASVPRFPLQADADDLVPVRLSDDGDASNRHFREQLYAYLANFNTWSIVASGTARNTGLLLQWLSPLLPPVLITVDSTVERLAAGSTASETSGNILRLMPSNDLQAQAIIAKIRALWELDPRTRASDVLVFSQPLDDDYVRDLSTSIAEQSRAGPAVPAIRALSSLKALDAGAPVGILVCVGYLDAAQDLLRMPRLPYHVIFSDGCYDPRVRALTASRMGSTDFHWARPAFDCADYALDAYLAARYAWKRMVSAKHCSIHGNPLRSIPFISRVQHHLERRRSTHYKFRSRYNQRGGYVVESSAVDYAQFWRASRLVEQRE